MSAERKAIRAAAASRIRAAATVAGQRVFASRAINIDPSRLPAVAVYSVEEGVSVFEEAPRRYKRELEVVIEMFSAAPVGVDDELDDLATAVESVMAEFEPQEELRTVLTRVEGPTIDAEGEVPIGAVRLTYVVDYYTYPDAPIEQDAAGVTVIHDLGQKFDEPDQDPTAVDEIDLQE